MDQKKQIVQCFVMLGTVLVVCRNKDGKYLVVREGNNKGWGLPGGIVKPPDSFPKAALKIVAKETGLQVELKGILRMEYKIDPKDYFQRIKFVFLTEPIYDQYPKNIADKNIEEARWVSLKEIEELKTKAPGWKNSEISVWPHYLEDGGVVFPLSVLGDEGSDVPVVKINESKTVSEL